MDDTGASHGSYPIQPYVRQIIEARIGGKGLAELQKLLGQLEAFYQMVKDDPEQSEFITRIIGELRSLIKTEKLRLRQEQEESAGTQYTTVERDVVDVDIKGNIAPGVNVGGNSTTTIHGGAAGGDHITGPVIKHADRVIIQNSASRQPAPGKEKDSKLEGQDLAISQLERDYLKWLREVAGRIPFGQYDPQMGLPEQGTPDVRLNHIYVPLDITRTQRALRQADTPHTRVPVPVMESVIMNRKLVVLGDPGSGKSTLLNYITLCLAGARLHPERGYLELLNVPREGGRKAAHWSHGPLLPVRVEMRELVRDIPDGTREGTASLVWQHIVRRLKDRNLGDFAGELDQALRAGQCLVMFDGLDEIIDIKKRQIVRDAVVDFAAVHAGRFLVTCRWLSYTHADWQLPGFPEVTLAPLSQESIDIFTDRWYGAFARLGHLDPEVARVKAKGLRVATRHLNGLAQNPMLLTVMAVLHTYRGTLPRKRARLYNECVKLLLVEWQRGKRTASGEWEPGIIDQLGAPDELLITALSRVAFEAHQAQPGEQRAAGIPEQDVMNILRRYLDNSWEKAQLFCDYVENQAGLLLSKGKDQNGRPVYTFPHRGFQEFLAARYIASHGDFAPQVARLAALGDSWHEVLLLAVGHLVYNNGEVYRPLSAIDLLCRPKQPTDPADWRTVWWAAEMMAIVGRSQARQDDLIGKRLLCRLTGYLVKLVEGGHLTPVERAQAADALGQLGDPRPGVCTWEPVLVRIEGGQLGMGAQAERHRVPVRPFLLARFPVTCAQFRRFLAQGYKQDKYWTPAGIEWRNRAGHLHRLISDPLWGIANRPAVGVSWHEAVAFANWLAARTKKPYRLPTEAEWEWAAAGAESRLYPFGSAAQNDITNAREALIGQTCAVGIFPRDRTPEGVFDMGGNTWEWTSSLAMSYPYRAQDGREDLTAAGPRILRGGSYDSRRQQLACNQRRPVDPTARSPLIGFRLACDI